MATLNAHYDKLAAGYLFPEISRRTESFLQANPGVKVMRLGIGDTTEPLKSTVLSGLHGGVNKLGSVDKYTGYGDVQGSFQLRERLAARYSLKGVSLDPREIFISDGAKSDSANIQSIFGIDNMIAMQDPAYPVYVDSNVISGRTGTCQDGQYEGLVYMPCNEDNGFFPDLPDRPVDLIYLCNPNNPTGAVATKRQLKGFVEFAREHQAVIFFDAAYCAYISDLELPSSIYQIEGAKSCSIEINSFSKDTGFTGVRLGWCIVPIDLIVEGTEPGKVNEIWNRRQGTMFNGPSNIAEEGGLAALTEAGQRESQEMVGYYMENATLIRSKLQSMGLKVYGGIHAPYLWLVTPNSMTSWDFFNKLLEEAHVVGTPGSGFGPSGEGYFRLSAFGHRKDIEIAVESIGKNLKL